MPTTPLSPVTLPASSRLLIVDDEVELLAALSQTLSLEGFEVVGAASGQEALKQLRDQPLFDILLTDLMMPGLDGLGLLKAALELDPQLVCVMMTGQGTVQTAVNAMKAGAFDYILKPFKLSAVLPVLARAVGARRLRLENLQLRETVAIYELAQTLAITLNTETILAKLADAALQQSEADEASVMLPTPEGEALVVAAVRGAGRGYLIGERVSLAMGVAGWVARFREMLELNGEVQDPRFTPLHPRPEIRQALSVPMLAGSDFVGVLNVNVTRLRRPFSVRDAKALSVLAGLGAAALQNARLLAQVQANEKRFRALIENAPDAITLLDPDGTVRYDSPAAQGLLGFGPDELLGTNAFERIHPDDRAATQAVLQQLVEMPGAKRSHTFRFRHKNGAWRWMEAVGANLLAEPSVQAIVVNYRDITERRQSEEALRASEKFRTLIVDTEPECVKLIASNGELIEMNSAGLAMIEADSLKQVQGTPMIEIVAPEYRASFGNLHKRVMSGESGMLEFEIIGLKGTHRWLETHAVPLRNESNQIEALLGVTRDITEGKRAEEAIRRHLNEMEMLYESGLAISRLLEPKDIADKVVEIIGEKLAWHHTVVRLYHPETDTIEVLAFNRRGMPREEFSAEMERVSKTIARPGQGLSGWVIQHGEAVRSGDLQADERYLGAFPNINSGLYVPIRVGERTLGVITVEAKDKQAFSEHDERLLSTLANQVAAAIENARLFAEIRQRLRELEAVSHVSAALRTAQTSDEMLPLLLEETLAALNTEAGAIWLYHPEHDELRAAVNRGWYQQLNTSPLKPGEGIGGRVFAARKIYLSTEFRNDPLTRALAREQVPPGWSGACLPIRAGAITVGVLYVSMPPPNQITTEQVKMLEALAEMAGAALHRMSLHEETVRRLDQLQALHSIDLAITGSLDLRLTLNILLDHVTRQLNVDAACLLLLNPRPPHVLEYAAGRGFRTRLAQTARIHLGESLAGRAALERRTVQADDLAQIQESPPFAALWAKEGFAAYYGLPLIAKGQVNGVLEVFHRAPLAAGPDWVNFLETLAGQAALAIDNAQLFESLQRSNLQLSLAYDATIEGWSRALDLRDKETEGHTQRVTEMTLRLARILDIGEEEQVHIRRGALLHDIGKMGVPDAILLKPGKLTDDEWVSMRKHPTFAYELLLPITYLKLALDIPHYHHEKWDGTGYPHGLKGEQIPLAARLFAVVDVWDALRSDRPYRAGWPEDKVLAHIQSLAGTHFEPRIVEVFLQLLQEDGTQV